MHEAGVPEFSPERIDQVIPFTAGAHPAMERMFNIVKLEFGGVMCGVC